MSSYSNDRTRWVWPYIARESKLTSDHLRRLEYAVETSSQVCDANHGHDDVPKLVKGLVAKLEPTPPCELGDEPPF